MKTSAFFRSAVRHARRGFTLMEMIIVLTIIALLVALAMNTLAPVSDIARNQAASADISAFKTALYAYQLQCGSLPTQDQGLKALWEKPTTEPVPDRWRAVMSEDRPNDPWNHPYQYRFPGKHNPDSFDIFSYGPDGVENEKSIGNWKDASSSTGSSNGSSNQ
jgi:general secretion pathway protein G